MPAHAIDWRSEAIASISGDSGEPFVVRATRTTSPRIVLHQGGRLFQYGDEQSVISIGRDPACNVVINDSKASRSHCRIFNQRGSFVLIDQSTNGTVITPDEGPVVVIRHELAGLGGRGWITLGRYFRQDEPCAIAFEVIGESQ